MDKSLVAAIYVFSFFLALVPDLPAVADEPAPVKYPFLEWYGLWPGRSADCTAQRSKLGCGQVSCGV